MYGFTILNSQSVSLTGGLSGNTLFHDFDTAVWGGDTLRLTGPAGGFNITGIANGFDGRTIMIINKTGSSITLEHEETLSLASNRLSLGGSDVNLGDGKNILLYYDAVDSRWFRLNNG